MSAHATVRQLAENTLTGRDLASDALRIPPDMATPDASALMKTQAAVVALVDHSRCETYVTPACLACEVGRVGEVAQQLTANQLIAPSLGLVKVLDRLGDEPFLFLLDASGVSRVVVRADIEKPPVGMIAFALLLALEGDLDRLILHHYGEDWLANLSAKQQEKVWEVYDARAAAGAPTAPIRCMMLGERLNLVTRHSELRRALLLGSGSAARRTAETLKRVRDILAHGGSLIELRANPADALLLFNNIARLAAVSADYTLPASDTAA